MLTFYRSYTSVHKGGHCDKWCKTLTSYPPRERSYDIW